LFGKLWSRLVDGGTREHSWHCPGLPLKERDQICYSALQEIFALESAFERMAIFRTVQMLGHF